jgi:hypothetical protein
MFLMLFWLLIFDNLLLYDKMLFDSKVLLLLLLLKSMLEFIDDMFGVNVELLFL